MRRLIWGFADRTYHIVGNLVSRLINVFFDQYAKLSQPSFVLCSIKKKRLTFMRLQTYIAAITTDWLSYIRYIKFNQENSV